MDTIVETRAKPGKYLTFALGPEEFGLEILKVREIIGYMDITAIPQTPEHVRGVVNLRGQVIPVVDLRKRFGLPPTEATKSTRIVVVEASGMTVGLVVDSVDEVRNLPTDTIEPPSPIVTTVDSDFLMGVGKLPAGGGQEQLVILLDLDRVTSVAERQALSALGAGGETTALPSGG